MFTIEQIKEVHSKVKSGEDFPHYIQGLIELGVVSYENYVEDGHTDYYLKDGFSVSSQAEHAPFVVDSISDSLKLKHVLKAHQQGETDYITFCRQAAEAGVDMWTVDMEQMLCIYYDKEGNAMVIEQIPTVI